MDTFPSIESKHYKDVRHEIQSGDILICSGNSAFSTLVQQATGSIWSHVAFILRLDAIDRLMVLESVESIGVRTVPLSTYICDYNGTGKGYPGRLMIARHQDILKANMTKLSKSAVDLLGYPYDKDDIVRIATRISMHALGIPNASDNTEPQHAFICSEYAHICFNSIGVHIDHNNMGFITPADFANHPKINPLYFLENEHTIPMALKVLQASE